jgi:3-oxocholest-4-en-26-oate---CoA ligase
MPTQGLNFADLWEHVADAVPDDPATIHGARRRTWREFDERSARLAAVLRSHGLGPGSKVACYLHNSDAYLETLFATFKLRGVPVNVNYRYVEGELAHLLESSDAEAVVFDADLTERVAGVRAGVPKLKVALSLPAVDALTNASSAVPAWALDYDTALAQADPMPRIARSDEDQLFLYTGGTTGMPKGVMWRQRELLELFLPLVALYGAEPARTNEAGGDVARFLREIGNVPRHLPAAPLMHGTGQFSTLQHLSFSGSIVTLTPRHFDADHLWRVVEAEKVRTIAIVGDAFAQPMLDALEAAAARGEPYDVSSVYLIVSSGVMWSAPVKQGLQRHGSMILFDSLGSSEGMGFGSTVLAPGQDVPTARFTVGDQACVLSDDGRRIVAGSGEVGVLAVAGPIPLGYYKDPAASARTFREVDGVRYSIPGDYATPEADGSITLLGRGSVCINTGGEKVYPEEVEEALKGHPAVVDCTVVGIPDERFGQAVAAVVSLLELDGRPPDRAEVLASVAGRLAGYKRPRHLVVVSQVRRGPNGKADYAWARQVALDTLTPPPAGGGPDGT